MLYFLPVLQPLPYCEVLQNTLKKELSIALSYSQPFLYGKLFENRILFLICICNSACHLTGISYGYNTIRYVLINNASRTNNGEIFAYRNIASIITIKRRRNNRLSFFASKAFPCSKYPCFTSAKYIIILPSND